MKKFEVPQTPRTPHFLIDFDKGSILLKGRFIPESNPSAFMQPIYNAIKEYKKSPQKTTTFEVKYEYVNTGNLRLYSDLFKLIKEIEHGGNLLICTWYIDDPEDDDSIEMSNDMSVYSGLKFQIICNTEDK